jgi:pyruvate formate lyase activating enzyme
VEKISLLPYHTFGEPKYTAMGKAYPWTGIAPISDEQIEKLKKLIECHGTQADVRR